MGTMGFNRLSHIATSSYNTTYKYKILILSSKNDSALQATKVPTVSVVCVMTPNGFSFRTTGGLFSSHRFDAQALQSIVVGFFHLSENWRAKSKAMTPESVYSDSPKPEKEKHRCKNSNGNLYGTETNGCRGILPLMDQSKSLNLCLESEKDTTEKHHSTHFTNFDVPLEAAVFGAVVVFSKRRSLVVVASERSTTRRTFLIHNNLHCIIPIKVAIAGTDQRSF